MTQNKTELEAEREDLQVCREVYEDVLRKLAWFIQDAAKGVQQECALITYFLGDGLDADLDVLRADPTSEERGALDDMEQQLGYVIQSTLPLGDIAEHLSETAQKILEEIGNE